MKKPKLRPLGNITSEIEPLLLEMVTQHEMQAHEIIGLVYLYLQVHCPGSIEVYSSDGTSPQLYYGPQLQKSQS